MTGTSRGWRAAWWALGSVLALAGWACTSTGAAGSGGSGSAGSTTSTSVTTSTSASTSGAGSAGGSGGAPAGSGGSGQGGGFIEPPDAGDPCADGGDVCACNTPPPAPTPPQQACTTAADCGLPPSACGNAAWLVYYNDPQCQNGFCQWGSNVLHCYHCDCMNGGCSMNFTASP